MATASVMTPLRTPCSEAVATANMRRRLRRRRRRERKRTRKAGKDERAREAASSEIVEGWRGKKKEPWRGVGGIEGEEGRCAGESEGEGMRVRGEAGCFRLHLYLCLCLRCLFRLCRLGEPLSLVSGVGRYLWSYALAWGRRAAHVRTCNTPKQREVRTNSMVPSGHGHPRKKLDR
uniref:Uncharacterized protein n=1 Tax=Ananas comosus var. bracteatus TaxID=296719 RepID=A0A6V7PLN0_ANACO|nr:unnamed protein product [Ananas comosus var. bracteatus]